MQLTKKNKNLYRKDLASIDKAIKMLKRNENIKMLNIRHIVSKSKHIIFSQSKSVIQFIKNRFKSIEYFIY